jgi:hypothetical protein
VTIDRYPENTRFSGVIGMNSQQEEREKYQQQMFRHLMQDPFLGFSPFLRQPYFFL